MSWEAVGISLLTASLVRPLGLAAASWLLLGVFRVRHPASRHAVWTAVLIGTTLLPVVSVVAPAWKLAVLPAGRAPVARLAPSAVSAPFEPFTPLAYDGAAVKPAANVARPSRETLILGVYLAGVLALLAYRAVGWALLRRVVARSAPVRGRLRESADVLTPVAVGVIRPAVILPAGWRAWGAQTRRAVLAHEFAHLRRRDTAIAALARLVQCVFWFHPLAWWLSRTIANLAELACDAAALDRVPDPAGYSRILLDFAGRVNRAGRRAALPGLAMASSAGMGRRIDQVFELSRGRMRRLSRPAATAALLGAPVLCLAATVTLGEQQDVRGMTPFAPALLSEAPTPVAQAAPQRPQTTSPQRTMPPPGFEVASIKPCKDGSPVRRPGRGANGSSNSSSGRFVVNCRTVKTILEMAFTSGMPPLPPIEGGPSWIDSERYNINAEAEGNPSAAVMKGSMLRSLLAERFHLKTHIESRRVPAYALIAAKGGPKLQPSHEGSCVDIGLVTPLATAPPPPPAPGERPVVCGVARGNGTGPNVVLDVAGVSIDFFARTFLGIAIPDGPVVNRTGIVGLFDIHLEFARDETNPYAPISDANGPLNVRISDPPGLSIFTALEQQLGLKLQPTKVFREFLVIDRLERPSEN